MSHPPNSLQYYFITPEQVFDILFFKVSHYTFNASPSMCVSIIAEKNKEIYLNLGNDGAILIEDNTYKHSFSGVISRRIIRAPYDNETALFEITLSTKFSMGLKKTFTSVYPSMTLKAFIDYLIKTELRGKIRYGWKVNNSYESQMRWLKNQSLAVFLKELLSHHRIDYKIVFDERGECLIFFDESHKMSHSSLSSSNYMIIEESASYCMDTPTYAIDLRTTSLNWRLGESMIIQGENYQIREITIRGGQTSKFNGYQAFSTIL